MAVPPESLTRNVVGSPRQRPGAPGTRGGSRGVTQGSPRTSVRARTALPAREQEGQRDTSPEQTPPPAPSPRRPGPTGRPPGCGWPVGRRRLGGVSSLSRDRRPQGLCWRGVPCSHLWRCPGAEVGGVVGEFPFALHLEGLRTLPRSPNHLLEGYLEVPSWTTAAVRARLGKLPLHSAQRHRAAQRSPPAPPGCGGIGRR